MAPRGLAGSVLPLADRRHTSARHEPLSTRSDIVPRSTSLSSGAKAGVVIGCIVGFAILCCLAWPFIARRKRREKQYHPSQDIPTHPQLDLSKPAPVHRKLSIKTRDDQGQQQPISQSTAYDSHHQKEAHSTVPDQSPFDPRYPVPPHYQDHPDYIAPHASLATAATTLVAAASPAAAREVPRPVYVGPGLTPAQVSIEPASSSRLDQLKDNARNKLVWSADKVQSLKEAWRDTNRKTDASGPSRACGEYDVDDLESRKEYGWFTSIFQPQDSGPSHVKSGGPVSLPFQPAHGPLLHPSQQLVSPAPSATSPPLSPNTPHINQSLEQHPDHLRLQTTLLSTDSGLPSPPIVDYPSFDPKHLWNPTTQSERQHSVNFMLETGSASASPPPQPPAEHSPSDHLQPKLEPPGHLDPRTPSPQPVFTPDTQDSEMVDMVSDISTPFNNMSSYDTPESRFTDSECNQTSPKSNMDSEMNNGDSPRMAFGRPLVDGSDSASTPAPSSVASPAERLSANSPAAQSSVASPREHKCDECGKTFEQIHRLNHHKRYHERKHECTVEGCNKKFGTKTHLDRHINDKHKKTRKFYCTEPTCPYSIQGGKSFPRKDNWVRHIRKKHRNLSVSQVEAQGFLIDEETGTAQSVSAPPSQNPAHSMEMGYGANMSGVPLNMGHDMNGSMGNSMGNGMSNGMHHDMGNAMGGMNNGMGMGMGINMQHPPMPPGTGFNSAWNMGPQHGY